MLLKRSTAAAGCHGPRHAHCLPRVRAVRVSASARPIPPPPASSTAAAVTTSVEEAVSDKIKLQDLPRKTFLWRGHRTSFLTAGCGEPIVLVHGFGACGGHYAKSIAVLSKRYKVYAVDLLGFGNSDKPNMEYTMELWRDQVIDFMEEFVGTPAVVVGNSIGSLASLMVAARAPRAVKGLALLNCTGALNNKGVPKDWRIILATPIILLVDALLKSRFASWAFEKYRTPENIRSILSNVYRNPAAVNDELVELLYRPSCDPGALDVFVAVLTGPPGPRPWDVVPGTDAPVLVLWGDRDPFTPLDGPIGKFFEQLPASRPETRFHVLKDVGHCPHDDRPEQVHQYLLPWLDEIYAGRACEAAPTV